MDDKAVDIYQGHRFSLKMIKNKLTFLDLLLFLQGLLSNILYRLREKKKKKYVLTRPKLILLQLDKKPVLIRLKIK